MQATVLPARAMRDDAGEPLGAGTKRQKLGARPVRDGDFGALRL